MKATNTLSTTILPLVPATNINIADTRVELVPQFTSRITRDFDQLFNQLMNAMSQRMLNHIGMYRFTQKKQLDESVKISRIMLGVGKKSKKTKRSTS